MNRSVSFRHLIALIVLIGMIISTVSLYAVERVLSLATAQRVHRAQESVLEVSSALSKRPGDAPLTSTLVGLRAGRHRSPSAFDDVPAVWQPLLSAAISDTENAKQAQQRTHPVGSSVLVIATQYSPDSNTVVWAGHMVPPPTYLGALQWLVEALAVSMVLLVAVALYSVVTLQRGVAALQRSLGALSDDLTAEIARPALRELRELAGSIAGLTERLIQSRHHQEELSRELLKQQRLAALGRVVAGVAHEVRNPLASIKLRLDLASSAPLPQGIEADLAKASAEITRLDTLVADLLAASGRTDGPRIRMSLGQLVRDRVEQASPWVTTQHVRVVVEGDAQASIEPNAVSRAIDNLLRNAVEASPRDGVVRICVAGCESRVWVEFHDEGEGVEQALTTQLFEPFFTTKPNGTGLGLAISLAVARAHGGDVVYVHKDSTTFVLSLAPSGVAE